MYGICRICNRFVRAKGIKVSVDTRKPPIWVKAGKLTSAPIVNLKGVIHGMDLTYSHNPLLKSVSGDLWGGCQGGNFQSAYGPRFT